MKISVIIPTIPGREEYLRQVIKALCYQALRSDLYEILIVWDGKGEPPQFLNEYPLKSRFVSHGRNRGLSAARNTGVENVDTELAMFLDDDLVPCPEVVDIHYRFHQHNPDPNLMAVGNVTWVNHPRFNGIMDWFEQEGGFSIFHSLKDGAPSPQFLGGITSFKTKVVKRIRFDESFTTYGCEDHEFGYRFFRLGGRLIFCEKALADHAKDLTAEIYYKDSWGGGYSVANMFRLHPDTSGLADHQLGWVLSFQSKNNSIQQIIATVNSLSVPFRPENRDSIREICSLLVDIAITSGIRQFWLENYPGYDVAERILQGGFRSNEISSYLVAIQQATEVCPLLPHLWFLAGSIVESPKEKRIYFGRVLELTPTYANAALKYAQAVAVESKDQATIFFLNFLEKYGSTLPRNTLRKCYLDFGRELAGWGKYDYATQLLHLGIEIESWATEEHIEVANGHFHLANIYSQHHRCKESKEELKKAEEELRKAFTLAPNKKMKCDVLIKIASTYSQQEKFKEAEEKLKEALSLEPPDKNIKISSHHALGSLYERKGDFRRAKEKFEEIIEYIKKNSLSFASKNIFLGGAHYHLGCIYQKMGEKGRAKHHFEECLRFIPSHGGAWRSLLQQGKTKQSREKI